MPYAGHQHPRPATQRGGGGSDGGGGLDERRDGLLHNRRHGGRMGEGVLRPGYGGINSIAGSMKIVWSGCDAHRWARRRGVVRVAGWCRRVEAVQDARLRQCHHSGADLVELRCGDGLLLALVLLLFSFSSSSASAVAAEGENRGLLGLGERLGVL
jgi:hypothetical protein